MASHPLPDKRPFGRAPGWQLKNIVSAQNLENPDGLLVHDQTPELTPNGVSLAAVKSRSDNPGNPPSPGMSAGFSRLAETSLRQAMERFSDCFYDTRGNRLGIAFEQREKINRILMSSASGQDPSHYAPRPSRFSLRHATNNMRRQWQNLSPETMYLIWHTLNAAQKRQLVPNPRILTALDKKWSPVQDLSPKPGKRPTRHFGALHRQAPDKKIVLHAEGYTAELIAGTAMEDAPRPSTSSRRRPKKNLPTLVLPSSAA